MTITIFRVDVAGDNIGNRPAEDIQLFNDTVNVNDINAFVNDYEISNTTGIGNNQAAEQDLGDHQDLGPVEQMYIVRGFITMRDQSAIGTPGVNPIVDRMKVWDEGTKTSDNFKHGRFGIQIDDMQSYTILPRGSDSVDPTDQIGLLWRGITWKQEYDEKPFRAVFEIQFIVDKGDDV